MPQRLPISPKCETNCRFNAGRGLDCVMACIVPARARHAPGGLGSDVSAFCKSRPKGAQWRLCGLDLQKADRKSTRLNSSHSQISYAVFCLKKKKKKKEHI